MNDCASIKDLFEGPVAERSWQFRNDDKKEKTKTHPLRIPNLSKQKSRLLIKKGKSLKKVTNEGLSFQSFSRTSKILLYTSCSERAFTQSR